MIDWDKPVTLKNHKFESFIRKHLKKTGNITLSDLREIKPLAIFANNGIVFPTQDEIHPGYHEYKQRIEDEVLKNGNKNALMLYQNFVEGDDKYRKIFGFCYLLGLNNIYDIGCGTRFQVGIIVEYKDISYTGIDCFDYDMPEKTEADSFERKLIPMDEYNKLFEGYNERIRFYKGRYPVNIKAPKDAIAILLGWEPDVRTDLPQILTRDFNRILLQVDLADLSQWKNVLEQYELYTLCTHTWEHCFTGKKQGHSYLYASKYPKDIELLKKEGYKYSDTHFMLHHFGGFSDYVKVCDGSVE